MLYARGLAAAPASYSIPFNTLSMPRCPEAGVAPRLHLRAKSVRHFLKRSIVNESWGFSPLQYNSNGYLKWADRARHWSENGMPLDAEYLRGRPCSGLRTSSGRPTRPSYGQDGTLNTRTYRYALASVSSMWTSAKVMRISAAACGPHRPNQFRSHQLCH